MWRRLRIFYGLQPPYYGFDALQLRGFASPKPKPPDVVTSRWVARRTQLISEPVLSLVLSSHDFTSTAPRTWLSVSRSLRSALISSETSAKAVLNT